ncbi:hypothetical protein [Streptomyces sp. H27-D2]|uniref:hypothetical protein n=1 Tax=Streptomyces sp. H27-D2 TaxID=3046304 RepID=UPI002DBF2255|nr:hypothetical protein [Streptomyces sp. H27-D2]MEC4015237.1 hypothetical protein [Streptomyces sp. H27-D2]
MSAQTISASQAMAGGRDTARLLRTVLRIDSASTAVMAVFLIAASGLLSSPTGMPMALSVAFGIYQLGGAAALALIAGYPTIPRGLGWAVIAVNVLSSVGCLILAFTGFAPLTGLGVAFMLAGAVVVAVFAELELIGLRRMARTEG